MSAAVDLLVSAKTVHAPACGSPRSDSVAVRDGRVVAVGSAADLESRFSPGKRLHLPRAHVYPGFMDPHCHFLSYGLTLQRARLFGAKSWAETVEMLAAHRDCDGEYWLQGRGWDQNAWDDKEFPTRDILDKAFPDRPVLIVRVDGHAAIANGKALELAGIDGSTRVDGGSIRIEGSRPTGLLLDNAIDLVKAAIPPAGESLRRQALLAAQEKCFAVGLTSVSNAGTDFGDVALMDRMQAAGALRMRVYAMLHPNAENMEKIAGNGPLLKERLTVRSFKMYADGALGSRGAWLLEPYSDDPSHSGIQTLMGGELRRVCAVAASLGFQMNVHAIGDAAVRFVLDIYGEFLEPGNDLRWRIEHAQIVHPDDLARFGRLSVIPSVQASHATSDMAWAPLRLGAARMRRAHAYRELLAQNGWLANGSDFPIEKADPLRGFRSAVLRVDDDGLPEGGFQPENSIGREEAINAMTIWAARANFEEADRGSLEQGKLADMTVLDTDLLEAPKDGLMKAKTLMTVVAGKIEFDGRPLPR